MPFKSVDSLKTQSLKPFLLPWINYFFLRISISAENLAGGTRDTIRSILAGESTLSGILKFYGIFILEGFPFSIICSNYSLRTDA